MKKVLTLCLIRDGERVLLGMKKRGFGQGRWNGFGGKVEPGERIEDAARREVREEAGIEAGPLAAVGRLRFTFDDIPDELDVHVFSGTAFRGEPVESDEMRPAWFGIDEIPFDDMWADDRHWFPLYLRGESFEGHFHFRDQTTIAFHQLTAVHAPQLL